jgi:ribose/xylose/arabinose/galactoside ABC-type transport system permease subunit
MRSVAGSQRPPQSVDYRSPGAETIQAFSWGNLIAKLRSLIGLIFVVGLFSVLQRETFPTIGNFELILRQTAVVGVGALGMTLIIIAGGIDLSVGSAIALVTVVIALLLPHQWTDLSTGTQQVTHGVAPVVAVLGGIAVGSLCGAINGTLITRLKLVPFIATLGMMSILRGLAQEIGSYSTISMSDSFTDTALSKLLQPIDVGRLWLFTPGAWMMFFLALLTAGMLRYTRFGRHIFAIGSNEQTARLCGVPVERTKLLIYTLAGALTAIAGIMHFSYLSLGDPTTAVGMELDIIAAVVIGGASLSGGQGTVLGSIVGALIMSVVSNGCNRMGWSNGRQMIVTGVIIILAVSIDQLRNRRTT